MMRALVAVAVLGMLPACASASTATSAVASSIGSPSSPVSPTTSTDGPCLFSVAEVSNSLSGTWRNQAKDAKSCIYTSDRGAIFATVPVESIANAKAGLSEARAGCIHGATPIATAKGGFVCIQQVGAGSEVEGNVATRGHVWLVAIVLRSGDNPQPQLAAMIALMNVL